MMDTNGQSSDSSYHHEQEEDSIDSVEDDDQEETMEEHDEDESNVLVDWLLARCSNHGHVDMDWNEFGTMLEEHSDHTIGGLGFYKPTVLHALVCQHEHEVPLDVFKHVIEKCPHAARLKTPFDWYPKHQEPQQLEDETTPMELTPPPTELPLHEACRTIALGGKSICSAQHIQLLLDAYPDALEVPSKTGLPLFVLCGFAKHMKMASRETWTTERLSGICNSIQLVLERYPQAAMVESGFTKPRLPIQSLLENYGPNEYRFWLDGYRLHQGTLSDERTPEQRDCIRRVYRMLLRATRDQLALNTNDITKYGNGCCLLCTALQVNHCNEAIRRVLQEYNAATEQRTNRANSKTEGNSNCLPIVVALKQSWLSPENLKDIILLDVQACTKRDPCSGRYPLFVAIDQGSITWENGMELLVQHSPNELTELDPETNLYPFLLAGKTSNPLDVVFRLLKSNVSMLNRIVDEPWLRMHSRLKRLERDVESYKEANNELSEENKRLKTEIADLKSGSRRKSVKWIQNRTKKSSK